VSGSNFIRVVASALVLSTLSFAAGVAGDLSLAAPPNYGARVVVRIPPEIPSSAPRAVPLISTSSAKALPPAFHRVTARPEAARPVVTAVALVKRHRDVMAEGPKPDLDHAPKTEEV